MVYYIRCTLDGQTYWYYAGTEKVNGKIEPCFISKREYLKTFKVQQLSKADVTNHLPKIKRQGWKKIEIVGMK